MASKTPSITRNSASSNTLIEATFTDIDDGDTWTSNIPSVVGYWATGTDAQSAQTCNAIDVALTTTKTGMFTFNTGEDDRAVVLHVLAKI